MTPMRLIKETTITTVETIYRIPFEYIDDYIRRALKPTQLEIVRLGNATIGGMAIDRVITVKAKSGDNESHRAAIAQALNVSLAKCSHVSEHDGDSGKILSIRIRMIDIIRGALNTEDVVTEELRSNSIIVRSHTVKITHGN